MMKHKRYNSDRPKLIITYTKEALAAYVLELEEVCNYRLDVMEMLSDALWHSGYDWGDCIDCGGPPHNEYCRFWKLRYLSPFDMWFKGQENES